MRHEVRLSRRATADLLAIIDWIVPSAGHELAYAYAARIDAKCRTLADYPLRGALRPGSKDIRSIPFERNATILYRVRGRRIMILRVAHAGQDMDRVLAGLRP